MSVSDTTPDNLPLITAPGSCPAEIETPWFMLVYGGPGVIDSLVEPCRTGVVIGVLCWMLGLLLCKLGAA